MPQDELVRYTVRDGLAHIELNRPGASNAIDLLTAHALEEAITNVQADARVRAVLVTGTGRRFCAGGDVRSFVAAEDRSGYLEQLAVALDRALQGLADLERPVVVAVQGAVAGAGLALMLSCDVVVAASSTRFMTAYARIGLTPDCGLSYLLPRAVGQQRALDLLLTGRVLSADEALRWGLVSEVQDDEDARTRAEALAVALAQGPAFALAQAKRLVRTSWDSTRAEAGREEASVIARAVADSEAAALISAFLTK